MSPDQLRSFCFTALAAAPSIARAFEPVRFRRSQFPTVCELSFGGNNNGQKLQHLKTACTIGLEVLNSPVSPPSTPSPRREWSNSRGADP
jgi:hypothetical protein